MRVLEPWHLIVLVVVIAVLFGSRRLPDAARGLGRSMRIFKTEMQQMKDDTPPTGKRPAGTASGEPLHGRVMDDGQPHADRAGTDRGESADARRDV